MFSPSVSKQVQMSASKRMAAHAAAAALSMSPSPCVSPTPKAISPVPCTKTPQPATPKPMSLQDEIVARALAFEPVEVKTSCNASSDYKLANEDILNRALAMPSEAEILSEQVLKNALKIKTEDEVLGAKVARKACKIADQAADAALGEEICANALKIKAPVSAKDRRLARTIVKKALAQCEAERDGLLAIDIVDKAMSIAENVTQDAIMEAALAVDAETFLADKIVSNALKYKSDDEKLANRVAKRAMKTLPSDADAKLARQALKKALKIENPDTVLGNKIVDKALKYDPDAELAEEVFRRAMKTKKVSSSTAASSVPKNKKKSMTNKKSAAVEEDPLAEEIINNALKVKKSAFAKNASKNKSTIKKTTKTAKKKASAADVKAANEVLRNALELPTQDPMADEIVSNAFKLEATESELSNSILEQALNAHDTIPSAEEATTVEVVEAQAKSNERMSLEEYTQWLQSQCEMPATPKAEKNVGSNYPKLSNTNAIVPVGETALSSPQFFHYNLNAWKKNTFFSRAVEHSIEKALRPIVAQSKNQQRNGKSSAAPTPAVSPRASSVTTARQLFDDVAPASMPAPHAVKKNSGKASSVTRNSL